MRCATFVLGVAVAIASPWPSTATATTVPDDCVGALPLDVRIGQVLMLPVHGDALLAPIDVIEAHHVGGVILMTWPGGADAAALRSLKDDRAIPLLVATDEEGGDVQRLRRLDVLPSAEDMAAYLSPIEVERLVADRATAVAELGVDVVFAPVVDIHPPDGRGPIGDRVFSDDPWITAAYAVATVDGWLSAGIMPVVKHFPGHGSASADTHDAIATTPPLDELRTRDLVPYEPFAGRTDAGVMVGHLMVPGLTDDDGLPASLSPAAIDGLLRTELGFADALVFTDAMNMGAILQRFTVPEAAVLSLSAGADVVLYVTPEDTADVVAAITAAIDDGMLPESRLDAAAGRVLRTKGIDPCDVAMTSGSL